MEITNRSLVVARFAARYKRAKERDTANLERKQWYMRPRVGDLRERVLVPTVRAFINGFGACRGKSDGDSIGIVIVHALQPRTRKSDLSHRGSRLN